ncbi:MAG: PAS domain S-box protein [Planctomycetota bacterium]|nr:PAS domain S-box protein [Planctomycetota bacterium]
MNTEDHRPEDAAELRQQAEGIAQEKADSAPDNIAALAPDETPRLLHELRVQQIELELQNDDLRRAQRELEARYRQQLWETRAPQACDLQLVHLDETPFWAHLQATVAQDGQANEPVCYVVISDITDRKRAEEALTASADKFRAIAGYTANWEVWLGTDGKMLWTNPAVESITGYSSADVLAMPDFMATMVAAEDRDLVAATIQDALGGSMDNDVEFRFIRKNGSKLWLAVSWQSIFDEKGNSLGIRASGRDITERKQAEEELRASEERLREVNALQQLLLASNPVEDKAKLVTEAVVRMVGADFARIWLIKPGDRCDTDCVHAQVTEGPHVCRFRDRCLHLLASSGRYTHTDGGAHARVPFGCYKIGKIAAGEETGFLTNEVTTDPRVHHHAWAKELGLVSFAGQRLTDADGTPVGVLALFSKTAISAAQQAMLQGISQATSQALLSARAEDSLHASEERFRLLFDEATDGMLLADAATKRFRLANRQMQRLLGYSEAELLQLTVADLHPAADLPQVIEHFERHARGETALSPDLPMRRKDGTVFYVSISSATIRLQERDYTLGIFRDVTRAQAGRDGTAGERGQPPRASGAAGKREEIQTPV